MEVKETDRYRQLLMAKREELLASRAASATLRPAVIEPRGDLADQAIADTEAKLQVHMRQTESRLLRAIEEGLGRIARGTFGLCSVCGNPISKVRLDAVPWTRLCRDCKEQQRT